MVYLAPILGAAALLSNLALAVPRPLPGSEKSSSKSSDQSSKSYGGSNSYEGSNSYDNNYQGSNNKYQGSSNNYQGSDNSYQGSDSNYQGSNYDNNNQGSNYDNSNSYDNSNYNNNNYESSSEYSSSTSTAYKSYETSSYGSGSNYNNYGSGYDDCVSQCIAKFGNSAYEYKPSSSEGSSEGYNSGSSSSEGYDSSEGSESSDSSESSKTTGDSGTEGTNGVTHTVVVAPSQGVLRYVPFALNASVGDTVEFRWGADGHTVNHGAELLPCNKTADSPFASGLQGKGFVYHQEVTTTDPTFFFCGAPNHCQQGMFGIINPPAGLDAPTSVSGMMQDLIAKDDDLKTYASITDSKVGNDGPAASWGGSIDIGKMDPEFQSLAAANVLYTRNILAMNADTIWKNNQIDLSGIAGNESSLMVPPDIERTLKDASASVAPAAPAATDAPAAANTDAPVTPPVGASSTNNNAAGALASPKLLVAFVAVVATFFAL